MKMETNFIEFYTQFVVPEKKSILSSWMIFGFQCPHPLEQSSLASYFPLKNLAFKTPYPLVFPMTISSLESGYGYFLELHNIVFGQGLEIEKKKNRNLDLPPRLVR